jgi:hypothetical protein
MLRTLLVVAGLGLVITDVLAQAENTDDAGLQREAKQRLELMQSAIADFAAESDEISSDARLKFAARPLLRYSDPTRGLMDTTTLLDASVWRLGEAGRPTALVTLEVYRSPRKPDTLSYEFLSFAEEKFSLQRKEVKKIAWDATGTDLNLAPLPDAPAPANNETGRLRQMRELARRFKVVETLNRAKLESDKIECRLMTQPIDRYSDKEQGIVDGALFVFANATNPEAGIVLETSGKTWSYGTFRLGAAALSFTIKDREVASFPAFGDYGRRDGHYTSASHRLDP